MAKKSMIARQKKRIYLVNKYAKKRNYLKKKIKQMDTVQKKYNFLIQLRNLPRDSSYVRLHNRCQITGRPKGYYRDFGLSRIALREMFHKGLLPGVFKGSW